MSERIRVPRASSQGEASFALHCRAEKLSPVPEYVFAPPRKWRFDFAFVEQKLAVEIEGGIFSRTVGRHSRGKGMEQDMVKYNTAALAGWRILRYSTDMVLAGDAINDVLAALGAGAEG